MRNDTYRDPEIIERENIIAKIYSPILTEKERDARMAMIQQASVSLILSKNERL
jgi:hypothetical protein